MTTTTTETTAVTNGVKTTLVETATTTVTKVSSGSSKRNQRLGHTKFVCYTDGAARDVADSEFFSKHDIGSLPFKSHCWNRVGRFAARIEADLAVEAIKARFGVEVELTFSAKAGCSCGCSPGFIGTIVGDWTAKDSVTGFGLSRSTVFVKEVVTDADVAEIKAVCVKEAAKLPAEAVKGNALVAAEQAALAEQKRLSEVARAEREARWAAQAAYAETRNLYSSLESSAL